MSLYPSYLLVSSKRYKPEPAPVAIERPPLWRVLHEREVPSHLRTTPLNMPEMRVLLPNHFSPFGEAWQKLSKAMNPRISNNKWTAVYGDTLWITNRQGFGNDEDPRANFILGSNLTSPLPKVEALTTGGSLLTGRVSGSYLIIEALDHRSPPSLDWILDRPWFWTYAVTMDSHSNPRPFPQGLQTDGSVAHIIHPLVCDPVRYPEIKIPLWRVQRWTAAELPDPFRVYQPV